MVAVSHAVEPELAVASGVGDRDLMKSLFVHALRAGLWVAVAAVTMLTLTGSFILDVWTHGKVPMHPELFACLLASTVASVPWYNALTLLRASNRHLRAASLYALTSGAAVGAATLLLSFTSSLASVGCALLIMDIVTASYTVHAAACLLDAPSVASLAQAANPFPLVRLTCRKASIR
jgi:O-antigen/teichoic acid export membrane protein